MNFKKIITIFLLLIATNILYGQTNGANGTEEIAEELELNDIVYELNEYVEELDLNEISSGLLNGEGINFSKIGETLLETIKNSIKPAMNETLFILIFLIIMAVIKSLELESDSTITKTVNIIATMVIISYLLGSYINILETMQETVKTEQGIIQVVSPFLMGILMLTGAITTTGLLEPLILLLVSAMGFLINNVIVPLITISVIFNIITNISDSINLQKLSNISNKTALWLNGILLTIFLGVTGLQTAVSTSVDNVTVKTTQTAVSSVIPVVR